MLTIILITEHYKKNPNTKKTYILDDKYTYEITKEQYNNIINSASFFRKLGGTVTQQRGYTCNGYNVTKDTATSPDRNSKTIRKFNFIWNN
jgi:hypothetical protein